MFEEKFEKLKENYIILITGKEHEQYIERRSEKISHNDRPRRRKSFQIEQNY